MDNQKHKKLELLCSYLVNHPISHIDLICQDLDLSIENLTALISELQGMGLEISIDLKNIQLHHLIDEIDADFIKKSTESELNKQSIHYHFITKSTNQLAQENKSNAIYISNFQTQGKGRQEKKWITPLGQSIALSLSHAFNFGLQGLSGLNIAIGVSIIQVLKQFGAKHMGLKWPNDIIAETGKVAGILIEASGNTKSCRAIIGIGINWNIRTELFDSIQQPCSNAGILSVTRNEFIVQLILNLNSTIAEFEQNKLQSIYKLWHQNDLYRNKKINIIQGDTLKKAIYKGINIEGMLNVEIDNKRVAIASGEVSIRETK